jgi:hypothetical protein
MMNSMNDGGDDFGANPFRSGDVFYDSQAEQQQQQQQHQQAPIQQSFQPSPPPLQQTQTQLPHDPFQPNVQTTDFLTNQNNSSFPLPSGPMDNMNMGSPQHFQQPAGLLSPPQQSIQQQQQQQQEPQTSWWGSILMCLNLNTYKMYFDIDADDVVSRVRGVILHFYKPEHFRNNVVGSVKTADLKGPDLYGPFWITMTLIFILGVSIKLNNTSRTVVVVVIVVVAVVSFGL